MAYTVTVRNSTGAPMTTADGKIVKPSESWTSGTLGDTYLHSDEFGSISFRDLGERHIGGDSRETWGCLITYQGSHMVGRYEGGGRLNVDFDRNLQATVTGMNLRHVYISPLIVKGEPAAQK
ncbi:MAG: hypothetical protein QOJ22_738 [Thermoleophilaceae bacterium]|jgi:hypothetical protein|nr:hypothetical protein [Thermoleophilaceae bacterium]